MMSPGRALGRDLKWKSTPRSSASLANPLSSEFSPPLRINGNGSFRDIVKSRFCVQHRNFFASLYWNCGFRPHLFKYDLASDSEAGVSGLSLRRT